ncbi:MAG: hypothetical protein NE334_04200 [Lentisphaeraceae bacterium]|nr:hypothetical protein [Lentisphaeraceae bacterium]
MKNAIIIIVSICFILFLLVGGCAFSVYKSYKNFPDYAQKEVVYKKYDEFLDSLDTSIKKSSSVLDLAAKIEKLNFPSNILYVGLEKDVEIGEEDMLDIVKKYKKDGYKSVFTKEGTGYGTISGKDIIVIHYPIDKYKDIENCVIYLEHKKNELIESK